MSYINPSFNGKKYPNQIKDSLRGAQMGLPDLAEAIQELTLKTDKEVKGVHWQESPSEEAGVKASQLKTSDISDW